MISVNMICKNEEMFIWFSIMSVLNHVDEIFICDTGSTDLTINLIKKIKSEKIHFYEKKIKNMKDFTSCKNEMLNQSKNEWILILDADEIWLESELTDMLAKLNQIPKENNLVKVFRREILDNKHISKKTKHLYATRLIRNFTNTYFYKEFPKELLFGENGKRKIWQLENEYYHFHNFIRSRKDNLVFERENRKNNWWYKGEFEKFKIPEIFLKNDIPEELKINENLLQWKNRKK